MKSLVVFMLAFVICIATSFAQQFNTGIVNPAISKVYQPAAIVNDYNVAINVLSISGGFANNGYLFTKDFLLSSTITSPQEGKDFFKKTNNVLKSASVNLDIVGPSVSYKLNNGCYIGLYTRFREIANFDRLNNGVFQVFNNLDYKFWGHTFSQNNFNLSIHSFNEIGFSLGKEIYKENGHSLLLGTNIKILSGISAASLQVGSLNLNITPDTINQLNGNFQVAYSGSAGSITKAIVTTPSQILNMNGPKSVGGDIGMSYEYRGRNEKNYLIKVSLSITDIGNIKYATSSNSKKFYINAQKEDIEAIGFKSKQSPGQYIEQLQKNGIIDSEKPINELIMKLPTAFRGNIDYNILPNFFLNTDFLLNVGKGNNIYSNTISLMPSYRNKWYAIGLPVASNKISGTSLGVYLKAGPLQLGSSAILSNLFNDKISNVDVYAAFSWLF